MAGLLFGFELFFHLLLILVVSYAKIACDNLPRGQDEIQAYVFLLPNPFFIYLFVCFFPFIVSQDLKVRNYTHTQNEKISNLDKPNMQR